MKTLDCYITARMIVIDPLASNSKLGTITNNLNIAEIAQHTT